MSVVAEVQQEPLSKQGLRVWLKLLKANATIETALRKKLREDHGTTLPRFDVMSALARHSNGLKMSEISDLLRVSNGNVTTIVDRLVENGLVERRQIPGDRRAIEICLTEAGQKQFTLQAAAHEEWISNLLAGLGDQNLSAFNGMLEELNDHLETTGGAFAC